MDALSSKTQYVDDFFEVSDGLKLHYRDYPGDRSRPAILCLHGLSRNVRDFEHLAERLSPDFRVIVLEFRGRGLSEPDPQPMRYNPLTYAGDVLQLLDHLQLPEAVFVGTSLGGLVTMAIAGMAPERIEAAVLNDVGPEIGEVGIDRILTYLGKGQRFRSWNEAAAAISVSQGPSFPSYTSEDWLKMARRNCREDNGEIVFDYDMAIAEPFRTAGPVPKVDMWPLFLSLAQKPLLLIRGEISELLSAATFDRMKEAAPDAQLAIVHGIGHAPELSEPEAAAAIDRFLGQFKQAG